MRRWMRAQGLPAVSRLFEEHAMKEEIMPALEHSAEIGELTKAMAAARKKFKTVKKETINPFFKSKYADLSAIIDATDEALADHELIIVQSPRFNGETV